MVVYKGYSSVGKHFTSSETTDAALVRADLINHFNTRVGERIMQPDFGCLIWNHIFDPFTDQIKFQIVENIKQIIDADPRVIMRNVNLVEYEHGLSVELDLVFADGIESEIFTVAFDQRTETATGI